LKTKLKPFSHFQNKKSKDPKKAKAPLEESTLEIPLKTFIPSNNMFKLPKHKDHPHRATRKKEISLLTAVAINPRLTTLPLSSISLKKQPRIKFRTKFTSNRNKLNKGINPKERRAALDKTQSPRVSN
jgi:hypothetical protein